MERQVFFLVILFDCPLQIVAKSLNNFYNKEINKLGYLLSHTVMWIEF